MQKKTKLWSWNHDSLVLGPAGWFQRAWSFKVAIDYFRILKNSSPTNQSIVYWDSFVLSSSLQNHTYQRYTIRCIYTERALEDIFVISASFIFCRPLLGLIDMSLSSFFGWYELIQHVAQTKKKKPKKPKKKKIDLTSFS